MATVKKDVVYIEADDDITAIIGRVKVAEHKIVALVPPKRVGVIQSTVNLKLVQRASSQAGKKLVIVSSDSALAALAASVGIPVARNLQSKPEVPETPLLEVDGEDIIDGSALDDKPAARTTTELSAADAAVDEIARQNSDATIDSKSPQEVDAKNLTKKSKKLTPKVPNFDRFRKKLVIIIAAVLLLVGGLVWALVLAPKASIVVTARTSVVPLTTKVNIGTGLSTSLREGSVKAATKSITKQQSVPGKATGKKDVGEYATGTLRIKPKVDVYSDDAQSVTLPAGTQVVASNDQVFATDRALTFNYSDGPSQFVNGKTVSVTAMARGTDGNDIGGFATGPSGFTVAFVGTTSGGTDETVPMVKQEDVDDAMATIGSDEDTKQAKSDLKKQFGDDYVVLDDTFRRDDSGLKTSPAVNAEASDGKFTISGTVEYTVLAIAKSELSKFLDDYFKQQIEGQTSRKVYSNGVKDAMFTSVLTSGDNWSADLFANGQIGPKIDEQKIKDFASGKREGEIRSYIESINGVDEVDVKLSPFWVRSAPSNSDKITIKFKVNVES